MTDLHMLEFALAAPVTQATNQDDETGIGRQAAVLLSRLVRHPPAPFDPPVVAATTVDLFLAANGMPLSNNLFELAKSIVDQDLTVDHITARVQDHMQGGR